MADSNLSVTPPSPISKDVAGFDTSIPLSPQWLLPKLGDSKAGMAPLGENQSSPYPGPNNRADAGKLLGGGDTMQDPHKKKDVYRPTFLESESAHRDRWWRDEERDTNVSVHRDRWREGEKELGDTRKTDRWADNSSVKSFGEARRPPAERWADPSKEAPFDQRRENKWSTRWGPDDKEVDKWSNAGKHGNASHDKNFSHPMNHGKDERESDHVRPWRPNSAMSRGRADPAKPQSQVTSKESRSFGHGRGRSDNAPPAYSLGHGRISNSPEKADDDGHGEASHYGYSRTKMLDLYRVTDTRLLPKLLDGFLQVPLLTQEEHVEPLALSSPTPDELTILRAIDKGDIVSSDKGDIVSSGAPQVSKDVSAGRGSSDFVQTSRPTLGSSDDLSLRTNDSNQYAEDSKDTYSNFSFGSFPDKEGPMGSNMNLDRMENQQKYDESDHDNEALKNRHFLKADDVTRNKDANIQGNAFANASMPWKPSDWFNTPADVQSKNSDVGWSETQKGPRGLANSTYLQNEQKWQLGEDHSNRRHQSALVDRELEARTLLQPSPEDLVIFYKDPQGLIQGPFSGVDIIGWFEAGYFGIDLLVRLANAPPDSPFSSLGDVMPHLRAKARSPPGFNSPKPNEIPDMSTRPVSSNFGHAVTAPSGIDMVSNEPRHSHGSMTQLENRFLESLMSSGVSSSPLNRISVPEGPQGHAGNNSSVLHPIRTESGDSNLLARRLALERQRSLSNSHPIWPGHDVSHSENFQDPSQLSNSQAMHMMSVLQGLPDRSASNINNGVGAWSNFPMQGGPDPSKAQIDLHYNRNFPPQVSGMQQQWVQPQVPQHPSAIFTPEKLLSSALSQDPQMLNLIQQQYLLEMQSQAPLPPQQLSILDKMLLLKQLQQEEQLRKQQQQLLSQVLIDHQQRFGEPLHGQLLPMAAAAAGSTNMDHMHRMIPQQILPVGLQVPVSPVQENVGLPLRLPHENCHVGGSEASPMQFLDQTSGIHEKSVATMSAEGGEIKLKDLFTDGAFAEVLSTSEAMKDIQVDSSARKIVIPTSTEQVDSAGEFAPCAVSVISHASLWEKTSENEMSVPEQQTDAMCLPSTEHHIKKEQSDIASAAIKEEVKQVEVRDAKKVSAKKSRKQKSKAQSSSEQVKGPAKLSIPQSKQVEIAPTSEKKLDAPISASIKECVVPQTIENASKGEAKYVEVENQNTLGNFAQQVWKPAATVKPTSLLEIQQEEEMRARAQRENDVSAISSSVNTLSLSAPWAGVVACSEPKSFREVFHDGSNSETNAQKSETSKATKSQLHDLLAAEVLANSSEIETLVVDASSYLPPLPYPSYQTDTVEDDFIEAKDTKKSRKKAGKNKGTGNKLSTSVSSADVVVAPSPIEKSKSFKQVQQERESLPAPPLGPSLGDFVPWKGEATSPSPAPAWSFDSLDSGKSNKTTSMRDILREQERKGVQPQLATPQKSQPALVTLAAPILISSQDLPQTKHRGEDDLFWGPPPEQSKQDHKSSHHGSYNSWGTKSTPIKAVSGTPQSSQKSAGRKAVEILSSPASSHSSLKGKRDGDTKLSEAMEFRSWCESESVRLIGSSDTSFLEFCLTQTRSEAEILLVQNIGALDPSHEFITKFLNFMDMLPGDVLDLAFKLQNDEKVTATSARGVTSDHDVSSYVVEHDVDSVEGGGEWSTKTGKKKGKKGKKVSPLVLGFNVVSNRIMMGEIQTLDE